jgi:excisionase family DNA binding protein
MMPRLAYSISEAAEALGLSARSLRYLIQTGRLAFARFGRRVVIPHTELERLLRRASVKATAPLDADEPIRPAAKHGNAPRGERGALVTSARERTEPDGDTICDITFPPS